MTEGISRAAGSSTLIHVYLINLIQFIIVIMCSVTMTTQSGEGAEASGVFNTSSDGDKKTVKTVQTFVFIFPVPCPPPGSLQLVCNNSSGDPGQTCDDRAAILNTCLIQYPGFYNNSNWRQCMDDNVCVIAFENVLRKNGFIQEAVDNEDINPVTTLKISTTKQIYTNVTYTISLTPVTTTVIPYSTSIRMGGQTETVEFPPTSYVYPFIGGFIIALEIVLLCLFSCYKKKRERQIVADSLVQQEEVIEPETVSPTKATLTFNSVYDEDSVFKEDKIIYRSYKNLKYIDDTSAESTPEKALLRS